MVRILQKIFIREAQFLQPKGAARIISQTILTPSSGRNKGIGTILMISVFILSSFQLHAQFRKYSNEFLNIGAGARGLAMGSSVSACAQDGTAGYWNPAGLSYIENDPQINLMHASYFSNIGKYDFASVAFPTQTANRTLGASFIRLGIDDIMNTLFLVEPDGSINYNNIQSFNSADYAFLLSFAEVLKQTQDKDLRFGINAKVIHRNIGRFAKAWGFGIDAGLMLTKNKWQFSLVGKDITTTFNTWSFNFNEKEKEALYLTNNEIPLKSSELTAPRITIGLARNFSFGTKTSLLAEADLDFTFDGRRNTLLSSNPISVDPKAGLELNINQTFFIRGGINNFQKALSDGDTVNQKKVWIYQPSAGVGVRIKDLSIDYAFTNLANQSNPLYTHIFSLKLNMVKTKH